MDGWGNSESKSVNLKLIVKSKICFGISKVPGQSAGLKCQVTGLFTDVHFTEDRPAYKQRFQTLINVSLGGQACWILWS